MDGGRQAWRAALAMRFRRADGRTVLAARRHDGPLVVQKPLYPEGGEICYAVLVHAPGGIAGGDALLLEADLELGARVLMTTPAATRWYKSAGASARLETRFGAAAGAVLEWLPSETIVFDEADSDGAATVTLDGDAAYAGWEIACLGRRASGERFRSGRFRQSLDIRRDGRLLWSERIALDGGDRLLELPVGLGGHHVFGSMVVAAGNAPDTIVEACRGLSPATGASGVTAPPGIVSARYLGDSAEAARDYFEALRGVLRPWYAGRAAERPRIWST